MHHLIKSLGTVAFLLLASCVTSGTLSVPRVVYQSIRTEYAQPTSFPDETKIAVSYLFNEIGEMQPIVQNLTDNVMIIDQTKSFVIMPDGRSFSYYDPTVISETSGNFNSQTNGTTLNLGAITNALGVGGALGSLAGGINVGSANTAGSYSSKTVTRTDLPTVTIGPKGMMAMSKAYHIWGIGEYSSTNTYVDVPFAKAGHRFSCCIYYSVDDGSSFQKIATNFYVSTSISIDTKDGHLSSAFTSIYKEKPDALAEDMFLFVLPNNIDKNSTSIWDSSETILHTNVYDKYIKGLLIDFQ